MTDPWKKWPAPDYIQSALDNRQTDILTNSLFGAALLTNVTHQAKNGVRSLMPELLPWAAVPSPADPAYLRLSNLVIPTFSSDATEEFSLRFEFLHAFLEFVDKGPNLLMTDCSS